MSEKISGRAKCSFTSYRSGVIYWKVLEPVGHESVSKLDPLSFQYNV